MRLGTPQHIDQCSQPDDVVRGFGVWFDPADFEALIENKNCGAECKQNPDACGPHNTIGIREVSRRKI